MMDSRTFSIQSSIDISHLVRYWDNTDDLIFANIESLMYKGAISVFKEIYTSHSPVVVETHLETWHDPTYDRVMYRLHYRLTHVMHRNIEIPVFTFIDHAGVEEWKCASCGIINTMDATYCGEKHKHAVGCGHPREFTK